MEMQSSLLPEMDISVGAEVDVRATMVTGKL